MTDLEKRLAEALAANTGVMIVEYLILHDGLRRRSAGHGDEAMRRYMKRFRAAIDRGVALCRECGRDVPRADQLPE